jgi:hypothetical protein
VSGALIFGIFTLYLIIASTRYDDSQNSWIFIPILLLSVAGMIYLYLPSIRARFESQSSVQGNS